MVIESTERAVLTKLSGHFGSKQFLRHVCQGFQPYL